MIDTTEDFNSWGEDFDDWVDKELQKQKEASLDKKTETKDIT